MGDGPGSGKVLRNQYPRPGWVVAMVGGIVMSNLQWEIGQFGESGAFDE